MPTYLQLQAEPWWGAEFQPPTVADLCRGLRGFWGVDPVALGSKGDNNHLYGYHRSRAWVLNSVYCTNTSYSVSETSGNRGGGDENWLCAIDITTPTEELLAACRRLDAAVRSGRIEKVVEWYGNLGGDLRVDGYDNIRNQVASSDSSHLWHLHISLDRGRAGENHDDLYAILTGEGVEEVMARQVLVQFEDGSVWLCDGIFRRHLTPMQLGTVGPPSYVADGPVGNTQSHAEPNLGNLGNGGRLISSSGLTEEARDVWGIDVASLAGGGGSVSGPVDLTPGSVAAVADAVADEESKRLQA